MRREPASVQLGFAGLLPLGPLTCSESGCGRPHIARGLCTKHYQRLQKNGGLGPRENGGGPRPRVPEMTALICEQYRSGLSMHKIARANGISQERVQNALKAGGVKPRPFSCSPRWYDKALKSALCQRYLDGASSNMLAREFGVGPPTITKFLKDAGIRIRKTKTRTKLATANLTMLIPAEWGDADVIYIVRDGEYVKIGFTARTKTGFRLKQLQVGNPRPLTLSHFVRGGRRDEARLHSKFAHLATIGEWFMDDGSIGAYLASLRTAGDCIEIGAGDDK